LHGRFSVPLIARIQHFLRDLPSVYKRGLMLALDLGLIPFALWAALSLRYGEFFTDINSAGLVFIGLTFFTVPVFVKLGLYRAVMRYLGWHAIEQIGIGVLTSTGILLAIMFLYPQAGLPRSTFIIYGLVLFLLVAGSRFAARRLLGVLPARGERERVAVYGAGAGGRQVAEMLRQGPDYEPVAFLDDAVDLQGRDINGLRVLSPELGGLTQRLQRLGVESILLSIPSASAAARRSRRTSS